MKKSIICAAFAVFILVPSISLAATSLQEKRDNVIVPSAEAPNIPSADSSAFTPSKELGQEFETMQTALVSRLDNALTILVNWENKISANTYISSATEKLLLETLEDVHTNVYTYKMLAQDAQSLEELRAINKEALLYLQENKDIIKETVRSIAVALGEEAQQYAEDVITRVEFALNILEKLCREESDVIQETELLLIDLTETLDSLELATQIKDVSQIKTDVKELMTLTEEIYKNLTVLEEQCL